MQGGFGDAVPLGPTGILTSTCPQPDQDDEQPMGCGEPVGEGQPGWERAPAAAPALEQLCRLVLSTPSSILRDEEFQEVRDPPASMGTPPSRSPLPRHAAMATVLPGTGPVRGQRGDIPLSRGTATSAVGVPLGGGARGRMLRETSQKGSQGKGAWGKHPGRLLHGPGA